MSTRISPTAFYTSAVWVGAGLSPPALVPRRGRALHALVRPAELISGWIGGPSLDGLLLDRHRLVDAIVDEHLGRGAITQVVEVAAGLSGRGLRMTERHPGVRYIEADLPHMAEHKRRILAEAGLARPGLSHTGLDALDPGSLAALDLDPERGVLVLTEGLINYLDQDQLIALWRNVAHLLERMGRGVFLTEILLSEEILGSAVARAFSLALGVFAGSGTHLHHATRGEAEADLALAGLTDVTWRQAGHPPVHVVQAGV